MDIGYIREFVVLAETKNFLEASERLFISQPSLSKHIKSIEAELGAPIFERSTRRVELNVLGELFLAYAKQITALYDEFHTAFQVQQKNLCDILNIGSIPNIMQYHITELLTRFTEANPSITLNITEAETAELKELLRLNKCDFAFIREASDEPDEEFYKIPYVTDTVVAILPSSHPLAEKPKVELSALKREHFLLLPEHSVMHTLCVEACRKAGFEPRIVYTGSRGENILDLVGKGMGVSLLSKIPAEYLSNLGTSIIDISPEITTRISIYYKKSKEKSQAAECFLRYVQAQQA